MNMRLTRRRVIYGAIMTTVVAGIGAVVLKPQRIPVDAFSVYEGRLTVTVDEDGRTRTAESYLIVAPVSGRVQRLALHEGEPVRVGQIVARIEPPSQDVAARAQAQADLNACMAQEQSAASFLTRARAERDQAGRELERRRELAALDAVPAEQLEQSLLSARAAQENTNAAEAALRAAQAATVAARARMQANRAPADAVVPVRATAAGIIMRVPERSARVVAAGDALLEIGDATLLEIVVDVLSDDAVRIRPGQRATIANWGGPPATAVVRRIEPAAFTRTSALGIEEQRVNVILNFDDCPPALGAGYRLDAAIEVWSTPRTLVAPTTAFFRRGDRWSVFVIEDGRARLRDVELGERNRSDVQIMRGLANGDRVIVFPGDDLEDGKRVVASGRQ